jgi:hypothetical protein
MPSIRRSTTAIASWRRSSVPELFELFDEYAAAYARGERPQAREYLARAGPRADELARLIDEFLQRSPAAEPDEETITIVGALVEGHPPLLELRVQRGLRREQVVDALVRLLGLDVKKGRKVADYYHQLEGGLLEPRGVDRRVWDALAETFKTRVDDLVAWRPRPAGAAPAYLRAAGAGHEMAAPTTPASTKVERDEIDDLFLFGANK